MKQHIVGGITKERIRLVIIRVAGAAVGHIGPGGHGDNSSRQRKPVIPQIHGQGQSESAARGISRYDDMIRFVLLFLDQPFVGVNRIL